MRQFGRLKLTGVIVAAAVVMAGFLAGCGAQPAPQKSASSSGSTVDKSHDLYVEVSALSSLSYFYDHKLGLAYAGKVLGVKTQYMAPTTLDDNAMISDIQQAIAEKATGIMVVGFDKSLIPAINQAVAAGIPVVTLDADLPTSKRIAFIGTGNFNAGVTGGNELAKLIGGKGQVALLTLPGQSNLNDRVAGYKAALAKYPGIQIVQIGNTQSDPTVGAEVAQSIMQHYPNLAGFGCVEAAGGAGAATAVKEANKIGKVKIVAMDRGPDVLPLIKSGVISASVAQQTALMPFYGVELLYNLKHYPVPITTNNAKAGITGAPINIDTGSVIVNQSNYKYFERSDWSLNSIH
ncbi:D-allose-binding periplasmic protein precursor [Peptococcaceae bacterium CEB3]|nr:D-allose-binding periplasmic protein precursor [Peptococcaceae bacterium CEB3]